ncbi:sensory box histidine kinase [Caenispirillum salinarum AK4]|uniref:histidine kinase n=1 Tax=Caenispirillum salinarum AK4 TaxID=1238182 RepID=K9GPC9_9PROT|nr:ATP-binding protein [Caenispirillum salinarum]EKV26987.1 sensory box histidine kinase [Caenispirillum salinarum AK4]
MARDADRLTLFRWMWRSYLRTALVPLLVVELTLIVAYFATNALTKDANIAAIRETAEQSLTEVARLNAGLAAERLAAVTDLTRVLQRRTADLVTGPLTVDPDEAARFTFDADGIVYYTDVNTGGAAGFYSGIVPVDEAMQRKAAALAVLDPVLRDVTESNALAVQAYYNTRDSYNRIYPFFDTAATYAQKLDIPSFNFYYEADAAHNPSRGVVWTDAYVDPAGQGWLTSAIAPVYDGKVLEGVVGIDITLNTIVDRVLDISTPWGGQAVLIGRDGTILAMPPEAEAALGLAEVGAHSYAEAVRTNTFKSEDYAIDRVAGLSDLPIMAEAGGVGTARLGGESHLVAWNLVPGVDWHLAVFVPEADLYQSAVAVGDRFDRLGLVIVGILVLFYIAFLTALYWVARSNAARLAAPLEDLSRTAGRIAEGAFHQPETSGPVAEITDLSHAVARMGRQLGEKTDRLVAASRSLEESDAFRRSLIENLPVPVVFFGDNPDVVIAHNSAYDALVAEHGHDAVREALTPMAADGAAEVEREDILELSGAGGRPRRYTARRTRLWHLGRRGTLCVMLDVSVLEEARASIAAARDRALEAARLKSEFLAKVTHELRTPLNGIIGLTELTEGETDLERVRRDTRAIGRNARNLLAIVEDLLDLSAVESGQVTVEAAWFTPARLVEDVLAGFRMQAREKGLSLKAEVETLEGLSVHGAGGRIRQVLSNLVGNAVKFTERGGVTVHARMFDRDGRSVLEVRVEDTGHGIPADRLEDIFQPFRQGDDSLTRRFGGAGLGLAIARELTERMGGSIAVESAPEDGASFVVTVPVMPLAGESVLMPSEGRLSCLMLGFDGATEALVRAILAARGAGVSAVQTPLEAEQRLRRGEAAAACVRVRGPGDVETVRRLAAIGPRVAVSAVLSEEDPALSATLRRLGVPTVAQPLTAAKVAWLLEQKKALRSAS